MKRIWTRLLRFLGFGVRGKAPTREMTADELRALFADWKPPPRGPDDPGPVEPWLGNYSPTDSCDSPQPPTD